MLGDKLAIGYTVASLPESCVDVVLLQRDGRFALTEAQRNDLGARYDRAMNGPDDTESEVLRLLTRPFSRQSIPDYYRYTSLHVYDWFLNQHTDQITAGVLALHTTLADLTRVERDEVELNPTALLIDRLDRLAQAEQAVLSLPLDPHSGRSARAAIQFMDETARWQAFLLASCTNFPMSDRHDEHLFLRSVHACEIAFYLIRVIALRCAQALSTDVDEAVALLAMLARYADLPNEIFHVLKTLTPDSFMSFREATGNASAVQSLNYHLLELALYGFDNRRIAAFEEFPHLRELIALPPVQPLREQAFAAGEPRVREGMDAVEQVLLRWRGRHYGFGKRYLPGVRGSGGTEGAMYLKRFVNKDFTTEPADGYLPLTALAAFGCR